MKIIFEAALNDGVFPDNWEKGNIIPIYKKDLKKNSKEVPQNFTDVLNMDDVTANDVKQRNQHRKEKKNKLEFHSNHWC